MQKTVQAYGAFVDVGCSSDGLVHISQLADAYVTDVSAIVQPGQTVTVRVMSIDDKRLALSMKSENAPERSERGSQGDGTGEREPRGYGGRGSRDSQQRPGERRDGGGGRRGPREPQAPQHSLKVGDEFTATVSRTVGFGAFLKCEDGFEVLLPTSEMANDGETEVNPRELVKEGQEIKVTVVKVEGNKVAVTNMTEEDRQQMQELNDGVSSTKVSKYGGGSFASILANIDYNSLPSCNPDAPAAPQPTAASTSAEAPAPAETEAADAAAAEAEAAAAAKAAEELAAQAAKAAEEEAAKAAEAEAAKAAQAAAEEAAAAAKAAEEAAAKAAEAAAAQAAQEEAAKAAQAAEAAAAKAAEEAATKAAQAAAEEAAKAEAAKAEAAKAEAAKAAQAAEAEAAKAKAAEEEAAKAAEAAKAKAAQEEAAAAAAAAQASEPAAAAPVANEAAPSTAPVEAAASSAAAAAPQAAGASAKDVKALREESGAGMMDCKKALKECNGDMEAAKAWLRKKGLASAGKKAGRIATEGAIVAYVHTGARLGVIAEINCETDFVARGSVFKSFALDMAMQIAACPDVTIVAPEDFPEDVLAKEKEIEMGKEDILSKPEAIREKMVQGRLDKLRNTQALVKQKYIKDDSKEVLEYLKETIAAVGENMNIRRFVRYNLGEGIEKKSTDFAAEVAQQMTKKEEAPKAAPAAPKAEEAEVPTVPVDAKAVKELREITGCGMMDCKKALAVNNNDLEAAQDWLRKKGLASAGKKAGRVASEGAIGTYIHQGSRVGVLIEVNCETDFVSKGELFKALVKDMAMQVVACPEVTFVSTADVSEEFVARETELEMQKEDLQDKKAELRPKIAAGRVQKLIEQRCLLNQDYIKDPTKKVEQVVKEAIATIGENIQIRRFTRFNLGEGLEKKSVDFAAEVAAATGAA